MIDIYLLDDDKALLKKYKQYILDILADRPSLEARLALVANSTYELVKRVEKTHHECLFFLDIVLPGDVSGLLVAQTLRAIRPHCYIVFVTTLNIHRAEASRLHIGAFDYMTKDEDVRRGMERNIEAVVQDYEAEKARRTFLTEFPDGTKCALDEVIYIKGEGRKSVLHGTVMLYPVGALLKEIEPVLNDAFCRTGKACIVNVNKINKVLNKEKRMIEMVNGDVLKVSATLFKECTDRVLGEC